MTHAEIASQARAPYARKIMELEEVIRQLTAERAGKFASPSTPIFPTVHMNGTSKRELVESYEKAAYAIAQAQDALSACSPNGRDYYPQGNDAISKAMAEFSQAMEHLEAARLYCYARHEHICDLEG